MMSKVKFLIVAIATVLVLAELSARAADVLDRIVATVNGHIILQSDWEDAVRFEFFTSHRSLDQVSEQDRKAALDRLIDQELLSEQVRSSDIPFATEEEVVKRINEIRKQYPQSLSNEGWQSVLMRFGITENALRTRIAADLDLMWRVDARLRPTVSIDAKSIESYYNQELLPQLRQSGAKEVPLVQVTPKIKELLTQQKMDQLLTAWLQSLRAGGAISREAFIPDSRVQAR